MFSGCTTLQQLNERRVALSMEMGNVPELNNAYNKARMNLMAQKSVAKLNPVKVMSFKFDVVNGIPYAGDSPKLGHIIATPNGFLV